MLHRAALTHHLLRIAGPLTFLIAIVIAACAPGSTSTDAGPLAELITWSRCQLVFALIPVFTLYFGMFRLIHEAVHGSLGLPRWANELALAVLGVAMATSGHALRTMHLRHHAHFAAHRALATTQPRAITLMRTAIPYDRRWQAAEHAGVALFAAAMFTVGPPWLQFYVAIAITAQLLAPFWAGLLIDHPLPRLVVVARRLPARAR